MVILNYFDCLSVMLLSSTTEHEGVPLAVVHSKHKKLNRHFLEH